jgi:uncharacterized protein
MLQRIGPFKYCLVIVLAFIFIFAVSFSAFGLKPFQIKEYVTDNAGLIQEAERSQLSILLDEYAKQTGNQILVVTIPSLEEEDLVDFTEQLFTLNKPGQKGKDNGIIVLIAEQERKIRIEVGYGLEGPVPDGKAGAIIREQITPYFKNSDYASGIKSGVYALITAITPDYVLPSNQLPSMPVERQSRRGSFPGTLIIILIVIVFSIISSLRGSQTNRSRYRRGYSQPWFWGGGGFGGGSSGGGLFGGGGGGFSGGGGGGGFGGGGASGGW